MSTRTSNLLLAAAASSLAAGVVFAQPEGRPVSRTPEQQLIEQIAELRAQGGPTPAGLIEPMRALAVLYQESGDHGLAITALEEARYVTRVHQGLSSVDEALLLRQQIRSAKTRGDHKGVWDLEQDMVTIARQHLDDIRTVPIFRDLAEDRSEALEQYRAGEFPPELELGCYYVYGARPYHDTRGERTPGDDESCTSGQRSTVIGQIRSEILMYYADAIEVILKNGDYASQELRDLERQALRLQMSLQFQYGRGRRAGYAMFAPSFCYGTALDELVALPLLGTCLEPVIHVGGVVFANVGGRASHVRLLAYEIRSEAPLAARATALAELADWQLVAVPADRRRFGSGGAALDLYERLYRALQEGDDARALTAQFFSPDLPVTLPTYEPNPFASAASAESSRYIDVSFDITKYGGGEDIEILGTSKNATRAEERELIRLIESTTFRPRVVDGELADAVPVTLRYHLQ